MKKVRAKSIIYFLVLVSVFIVLFGFYQNAIFHGDLKSLWFYSFIDKLNPIEDHPFDFIREDKLRTTSIFVSPLIYSCFLSYTLILLIYAIFLRGLSRLKKLLAAFILLLILYGELLSRTRIGFIILIVGLCSSLLIYKRPSSKLIYSILIPLFFFLFTIVSLIFGATEDLSALGRLVQYASVPSNFNLMGLGFGAEMTNVFFDSFYISVALLFGFLFPLYLRLYYILLKQVKSYSRYVKFMEKDSYSRILFYSNCGFSFSFIYTFGFHFTIGSAPIQIFYLLLFYFVSKYPVTDNKAVQNQNKISYEDA